MPTHSKLALCHQARKGRRSVPEIVFALLEFSAQERSDDACSWNNGASRHGYSPRVVDLGFASGASPESTKQRAIRAVCGYLLYER